MEIYRAQKKKKPVARVALLTGCVQKVISPQINEATIRLLNRHNIEVVVSKGIDCCGSLNHHLGKSYLAHKAFKKNISIWYEEYLKNGLDAIISNTSGCGTTLKDYGFIFRSDNNLKIKAKKISELTKDISEYLDENVKLNFIKNKENNKEYKIAYHSACSMQHGQKVHDVPINLIKKTGNQVFDIPDGHLCCGSAGTYNLLQNDIAKKLLKNAKKSLMKPQSFFNEKNNKKLINFLKNENNDLEKTVIKIYPKIKKIIDCIKSQKGCYFSRITGSGSACIGIFSNTHNAIYAQKAIRSKYPKYWSVVSKTI